MNISNKDLSQRGGGGGGGGEDPGSKAVYIA